MSQGELSLTQRFGALREWLGGLFQQRIRFSRSIVRHGVRHLPVNRSFMARLLWLCRRLGVF